MNSSYPNASDEDANPVVGEPHERNAFRFSHRREHSAEPTSTAPVVPAALPGKPRPRGRVLIAILMMLACGAGAFTVWDSLFRYRAYGVVTGHIIDVAVPVEGILTSIYVKEGDNVRQSGQLAKVTDLDFEQQLARVTDELRIAEATLQAEVAKVKWQSQVDDTEMTKSIAELYESTGRMQYEHGSLELLRDQLERKKELHLKNSTSHEELNSFTIQEKAKQEELNSLQQWVAVLKERAKRAAESPRLGAEQIEPMIAKSEMLLNEILRLRDRIDQGNLRSPVNGTVLHRYHPAGECIKPGEPLFSVIEESSLEVEVFLPQHLSDAYKIGDTIELKIEPLDQLVPCEVISIGAAHRRPPENIEVFYRSHVRLLPIRVKPLGAFAGDKKLSVGAIAKLPHFGIVL